MLLMNLGVSEDAVIIELLIQMIINMLVLMHEFVLKAVFFLPFFSLPVPGFSPGCVVYSQASSRYLQG